jgi:prophage regulatory protein
MKKLVPFEDLRTKFGVPYTRRHIYNLEAAKKFPMRVPIGENRVAWVESEVQDWVEQKISTSRQ